jgi:signal peptidase II
MIALFLTFGIVLLDQLSKEWVLATFKLHESWVLIPHFFSFTYIRNTGAAWGMFSGQNLALSLLAAVMLLLLALFRRRLFPPGLMGGSILGFLCGGILGNLFDRLRHEYVVDFLDFYIGTAHWPAFNVADAAICIGVGLFLLASFRNTSAAIRS